MFFCHTYPLYPILYHFFSAHILSLSRNVYYLLYPVTGIPFHFSFFSFPFFACFIICLFSYSRRPTTITNCMTLPKLLNFFREKNTRLPDLLMWGLEDKAWMKQFIYASNLWLVLKEFSLPHSTPCLPLLSNLQSSLLLPASLPAISSWSPQVTNGVNFIIFCFSNLLKFKTENWTHHFDTNKGLPGSAQCFVTT